MKHLRDNRRLIVVLAVVIVLVFSLSYTSRRRNGVTVLEALLIELLAPVQAVAERAVGGIEDTVYGIASLRALQAENEQLRQQLAEMSQLEIALYELRRENVELKHILGLVQEHSGELDSARVVTTARVIGRNPDNWFRYVTINKGTNDDVSADMVVIVPPRILVGRIIKVTPSTATVMLLSDPESGVGGLAQITRDTGVVLGGGGDLLEMKFFSREARPYEGQAVMTSGLGQLCPPNLLIGTIRETGSSRQGVLRTATVNPFADLDHLDYLVIVEHTQR
jgi:rod shape-determining protein MreC